LLLWGAGGTLKLDETHYEFRDPDGHLIDAGGGMPSLPPSPPQPAPVQPATPQGTLFPHTPTIAPPPASFPSPRASQALQTLREFLRQYTLPASPHRGWEHHLEEIAATMEALIVSHRTGQPESPERFRHLRR
jgi:hypothetical protein